MNIEEFFENLDKLYSEMKYNNIEPFLLDSLQNATDIDDNNAVITIINELIGFYREVSQYDKAEVYIDKILSLMNDLGLEGTIYYATTLLNIANLYRSSGKLEISLKYFKEVFEVYNKCLDKNDMKVASLNNNIGLLYEELQDFESAKKYLNRALKIVKKHSEARIELAVTYSNIALCCLKLNEIDNAKKYVKLAMYIFEKDEKKDSHYSLALSVMGEINYKLGNYKKAEEYYQQTLDKIYCHFGKNKSYYRVEESLKLVREKLRENLSYIDICEKFYYEFGAPMIREKFPEYENRIAVGVVGEGSERLGFDDEISKDHDYEIGFSMWLTDEDYKKIGLELNKEYIKLPTTYMGVTRSEIVYARNRVGICRISNFYKRLLGRETPPETLEDWLALKDENLKTVTNGKVFRDDLGQFTEFRNKLLNYYPEEVRLVRLAELISNFSRSMQYNYSRMMIRRDYVSAQILLNKGSEDVMKIIFILNKQYYPYDKWLFKGIKNLPILPEISQRLEKIAKTPLQIKAWENITLYDNEKINYKDENVVEIEEIAKSFLEELKNQKLTFGNDFYLDNHTENILDCAEDKEKIIDRLIELEWEAFDKVSNLGGRADCQDDFVTFEIMRKSQYLTWDKNMLLSFCDDFEMSYIKRWNLITEKYARMMESTAKEEYEKLKDTLPKLSEKKIAIIEELIKVQLRWFSSFAKEYPKMAKNARVLYTKDDTPYNTSYETYLRGELRTYSDRTLDLYGRFIVSFLKNKENLVYKIMENTAKLYGYKDLKDCEKNITNEIL